MLILDIPSDFDGVTIKIPLYHRGHLSLFPEAKVWLCLLPGAQGGQFLPEIVISPIDYESWGDLWRISITLHDRIGLVHDIFQILADQDLNIIAAESSSMERQRLHSIEILVNANKYGGDGGTEERSSGKVEELKDLRRAILARVLQEIAFLPSGEPRLKIRRLRHLFEAMRSFNEAKKTKAYLPTFKPVVGHTEVRRIERKGVTITLPAELRKSLLTALGTTKKKDNAGQYLLISNTADRFLRVYFVKESDVIVAPTILHDDEVGALAAITGALQAERFNILTSLSRLYKWGAQAHSEFVLQPPPDLKKATSKAIKRRIKDALSTRELVTRLKIAVCYPNNYHPPLRPTKLQVTRPAKRTRHTDDISPDESTQSILDRQIRRLLQVASKPARTPDDVWRYRLGRDLMFEEEGTLGLARRSSIRNSLFISCAYHNQKTFDRVVRTAKANRFNVITAKDSLPVNLGNRPGIIKQIDENCTHFLGVWSEDGGTRVKEGEYFPSPWLYWELGVANALGLHCHLLISEKIMKDAWARLIPDSPHTFYSSGDFESQLKSALKKLQALLPTRSS